MSATAAQLNTLLIGTKCTYINNEVPSCPYRHFRYQTTETSGVDLNICFVDMQDVTDIHITNVIKAFASQQNAFLIVPNKHTIPHIDGLSLTVYSPATDGFTDTYAILDSIQKETGANILRLTQTDKAGPCFKGAQHAISRINSLCSLCPLSVDIVYMHPVADVIRADRQIRLFIKNTQSESYIPIFVAFALALRFKH